MGRQQECNKFREFQSRTYFGGALIIACLLFCGIGSRLAKAETVTIGVPVFNDSVDFVTENGVVPAITRAAVGGALVRADAFDEDLGISAAASSSFTVSFDFSSVVFRIKKGSLFTNGNPILARDIVYSLERCMAAKQLPLVKKASIPESQNELAFEDAVRLELQPVSGVLEGGTPAEKWESYKKLLWKSLGRCLLVEEASSTIFGSELGKGTLMVSTGDYFIDSYNPGKELVFRKTPGRKLEGAAEVVLRAFEDSSHGLTALRTGTIDAFFTQDESVLEKARKDETLSEVKCSIYMVVTRRGFNLSCNPRLDVSAMGYFVKR